MSSKRIFILEDRYAQRIALSLALEARGFQVESAATVEAARSIFSVPENKFAVVVLDMRLEDPDQPHVTGADIGLEIARSAKSSPPEFLIYSAYGKASYYKQALELGVATYINKSEATSDVIRHIRVLALRYALNAEGSRLLSMSQLLKDSRDLVGAVSNFFEAMVAQEASSTLGVPFVFLITDLRIADGTPTFCCGTNMDIGNVPDTALDSIQSLVFLSKNENQHMHLTGELLGNLAGSQAESEALLPLTDSVFVPLVETGSLRLSIGLMQQDTSLYPLSENASGLATVIAQYLKGAVFNHIVAMLFASTEEAFVAREEAERAAQQRQTDLMTMTHQLQSPLISAIGSLSYLSEKAAPKLKRQIEESTEILEDALALCSGTSSSLAQEAGGRAWFAAEPIELMKFVMKLFSRLQRTNGRDDLILHNDDDAEMPALPVDRGLLTNVLYSLLHNIMKYADRGSTVKLRGSIFGRDRLTLRISSRGEPIREAERYSIFQKFKRGSTISHTGRYHSGSGLGLWVARSLMVSIEGDLTLELTKRDLRVSTFVLKFPLEDSVGAQESTEEAFPHSSLKEEHNAG